jgi:hypothetical protein
MNAPKDQTVGQLVVEAKEIETQAPVVAANVDSAVQYWAQQIEDALPGTDFAVKVKQIATQAKGVETQVDKDVVAAQTVTQGLAIPLALAGGITVKGSGQLAQSVAQVASAVVEAKDGVQSSMTKSQKIISEVVAILQFVSLAGGLVLQLWPNVGGVSMGGGVTVAVLLGAVRNYLMPKLSQYADSAPRAVLVQPPT